MAKEKTTVGIDIGSNQIKVLVTQTSNEPSTPGAKNMPRILGIGLSPSNGIRRGYIEDVSEVAESLRTALQQAEKTSGIKIKKAEISVGDCGIEYITSSGQAIVSRADQEITELDISKAIDVSQDSIPKSAILNRKVMHQIPVSYKIDGKVVMDGKPIGMKGSKVEVKTMFITGIESHLSKIAKVFEANEIEIVGRTVSPFATTVSCLLKSQKIAGCVLVNIGAETTSLVVYEDNLPISVEILPLGGQDITNDIALGLKISISEAESVKVGAMTHTNVSKKKLDEIIDARLSDIFELIETHLKKINRNHMLPAGIFITGGSSKISDIEDFAKDFLKLPAKVVSVPGGQLGKSLESIWSTAYGLCLLDSSIGEPLPDSNIIEQIKKFINWSKQFLP
jgi:cell division protein FtsA